MKGVSPGRDPALPGVQLGGVTKLCNRTKGRLRGGPDLTPPVGSALARSSSALTQPLVRLQDPKLVTPWPCLLSRHIQPGYTLSLHGSTSSPVMPGPAPHLSFHGPSLSRVTPGSAPYGHTPSGPSSPPLDRSISPSWPPRVAPPTTGGPKPHLLSRKPRPCPEAPPQGRLVFRAPALAAFARAAAVLGT